MNFLILNPRYAQKIIIPLYVIVVLGGFIEQWIADHIQAQLSSSPGVRLYLFGFLSLIFSLFYPAFLAFLMGKGLMKGFSVHPTLKSRAVELNQLMIETTRSWGQVLGYFLLLIIPGLIRYLQCIFVPFVVLFSKEYAQGRRDALKRSTEIFHKNLFRTLLILMVFQLVLPMTVAAVFQGQRSYFESPMTALAVAGIDTFILLLLFQGLFLIFQKESKGELIYE